MALHRPLAEGVVDPGGRAAGFPYFEQVADPGDDRVDFRFTLVDASAERSFGAIEIPFRADSGLLVGR